MPTTGNNLQDAAKKVFDWYMNYRFPEDSTQVLQGDPGFGPAKEVAGVVMNPKNAVRIAEMLKGSEGVDRAISYLALKYPRLSGIPSKIWKNVEGVADYGGGFYSPQTKEVNLVSSALPTTERAVEVGGHELTHAFRDRTGWINRLLEFNGPTDTEEMLARQGGATARKTYEKFLSLLK